ncbi:MAG: enoyl-CoA hydratase-related protein [Acidiferrobacterales bacterium]
MSDTLLSKTDDRGVCTLTLNRPQRHNAFDNHLIEQLRTKFDEVDQDASVRVVVLTGAGKSFSSGADLEWMRGMAGYDETANRKDAQQLADMLQTFNDLSKPKVAAVNGVAFAGAIGLIACCDIAIANRRAAFALTEVRLGLAPAVISPYVIAAIGTRQARRFFLTGERINADEAQRIGLVHQVVDEDALAEAVNKQVEFLLHGGPDALKECKRLAAGLVDREDIPALIARMRVSPEGQEGMAAFFEKRKPGWIKS